MIRHLLPSLLLAMLSSPSFAQQNNAEVPILVSVDQVSLPHLIIAIGSITNTNVVVGPGIGGDRLRLHDVFKSPTDFYTKIARENSAELSAVEGVTIIKHRCTPLPTSLLSNGSNEKITLHFERTSADTIASIMSDKYTTKTDASENVTEDTLDAPISFRLREATEITTWNALAIAMGVDLIRKDDKTIARREAPALDRCEFDRSSFALEAKEQGGVFDFKKRACWGKVPDDSGKAMKCEPLETYPLSLIKPKGFITYKDRKIALIETPDGLLYPVRQGNYIGYDFGKIIDISEQGIRLQEYVIGKKGDFVKKITLLAFTKQIPK